MNRSIVRGISILAATLLLTSCYESIEPVLVDPIEGYETGVVLQGEGAIERTLFIPHEQVELHETPEQWINEGWVLQGLQIAEDWEGTFTSLGRGQAGVGDWTFYTPAPGPEWNDPDHDPFAEMDEGTAWFVLHYVDEEGGLSLLSVGGTIEVLETNEDWAAGTISVELAEQDFDTGELIPDGREATLRGTFNVRSSVIGEI